MNKNRVTKQVCSIIVDGKTEKWYLDLLKSYEKTRLSVINIKPEIPKRKSLKELYQQAQNNVKEGYDKVIWVVDFDVILRENKTEEFKRYYNKLLNSKNKDKISILVNNPCFEYWLLLHLQYTDKQFSACSQIESILRDSKVLSNYQKTEKFYKKLNNDIYRRLIDSQKVAIRRAKRLGNFNPKEPKLAKVEFYKVFDIIFKPKNPKPHKGEL